jgi:hypothetical protein
VGICVALPELKFHFVDSLFIHVFNIGVGWTKNNPSCQISL